MKQEDIEFLKGLKKAIKEGDRCYETEPAFWMIIEKSKYQVGSRGLAEGARLISLVDGYHEFTDYEIEDVKYLLQTETEEDPEGFGADLAECETIKDVIGAMEDNYIDRSSDGDVEIEYYATAMNLSTYSGAFLTYEDAKKHFEQNRHNYAEEAYPYALTAFRNPTFERLWRIITETDWEKEEGE